MQQCLEVSSLAAVPNRSIIVSVMVTIRCYALATQRTISTGMTSSKSEFRKDTSTGIVKSQHICSTEKVIFIWNDVLQKYSKALTLKNGIVIPILTNVLLVLVPSTYKFYHVYMNRYSLRCEFYMPTPNFRKRFCRRRPICFVVVYWNIKLPAPFRSNIKQDTH
jgi:hypothetical protein